MFDKWENPFLLWLSLGNLERVLWILLLSGELYEHEVRKRNDSGDRVSVRRLSDSCKTSLVSHLDEENDAHLPGMWWG